MEVFFYGLFMDIDLLEKRGLKPSNPRMACLKNYELKIGDRATLVPCKNERSYGIVMTIDEEAINKLYSESSAADYIPEEVTVVTDSNDPVTATCYNLPVESHSGSNKKYALSLYKLAKQEDFPEEYVSKIKMIAES
ncbi:MAG: gamma-glutamylcyclotransferase [Chitinophagales bacterium]|nr:gamma-glutamylcyclotransferase [Chitinophagales bacterium]